MNPVTWFFPVAAILLLVLFFIGMPSLRRCPLDRIPKSGYEYGTRDFFALGLIVIVYAFVAFYNLGSTEAPQSFHRFSDGESLTVTLSGDESVSSVMYYTGIGTGSYTLQYSDDGESFYDAALLDQNYAALLKWKNAELYSDVSDKPRSIRIIAHGSPWLGELALRTPDGRLIPVTGGGELFDEQATVPEYPNYLNSSYFDEIYHARTAYEHIEGVYPYEVSHPPLGKLIIAGGIELFGMTPFGWRFSGTLIGVLMLPLLYVLLKKMFGGVSVPACGTAIFPTLPFGKCGVLIVPIISPVFALWLL